MLSLWESSLVHDRPATKFDWGPIVRYGSAYGGLAVIAYFAYEIFITKHLDRNFKYGAIGVMAAIGIIGAMAILQRDPVDSANEHLYTAAEVAELLNAVRAAGGRYVDAARNTPATCIFCGEPDASVRGLDGSQYHRRCFQTAYREREERARAEQLR